MNNVPVSVVITSYNHEEFIGEAIESVLRQSAKPAEIIVVDDGSSDSSPEIIKSFGGHIISLLNRVNKGGPANQNEGMRLASQPLIAVLNSDDAWKPSKIERQIEFMETRKLDASFTTVEIMDHDSNKLKSPPGYFKLFGQTKPDFDDFLPHFFYKGNFLCHSSVLATRALYERTGFYDNRFRQLPDFNMWIKFAKNATIGVLDEDLVRYRYLGERNTSNAHSDDVLLRTRFEHLMTFMSFFDGMHEEEIRDRFKSVPGIDKLWQEKSDLSIGNRLLLSHPEFSLQKPAAVAGLIKSWAESGAEVPNHEIHNFAATLDIFSLRGLTNTAIDRTKRVSKILTSLLSRGK
jgi:glycosyltransferase involved in cell wall biosynthesis